MNKTTNQFQIPEVELIYRRKLHPKDRPIVKDAASAYSILKQAWDLNKIELQEEFKILLLARDNACIGVAHIATGGISSCVVDAKIVFATALKAAASSIVMAHNHPSGNLKPSDSDITLTDKIVCGGKLLDIDVFDHLIVSRHGYKSFAQMELLACPI